VGGDGDGGWVCFGEGGGEPEGPGEAEGHGGVGGCRLKSCDAVLESPRWRVMEFCDGVEMSRGIKPMFRKQGESRVESR
jgi:hypothetical protein